MRAILRFLKKPAFLTVFGLVLLITLIVLIGDLLGDETWIYRLVAFIVVLIIAVVVLAIRFARANRSSDEIEKSIKKQAEQQLISTRPDKQSEIQELQEQLERAIEQLKASKLGRGKRGRAALYALPWYLFIGPPGAGKTTAITESGLNFPLGSDRVRGVGGTRNCDWFFSDQAILLDTAGRYMTEQEDADEWLAFLDTLKQHRSERPINGVIIGMAMPDLAIATPDEIEWHADNIRRRADELVGRLGVRFPVYLVFTKCDMLQGFVEFFGELSRREREQIWGCTLDEEQQRDGNLRHVFDAEFDRLANALINRRSARLSRPMKREERQKVYAFPLQVASIKENLSLFVGRLFQPNPYQENPVFRGFYFTSGTQEGVPLDRVILAIARQFELPTTGLHQFETQEETKSYFIKDLFTDVIVPDQHMVRRTSKARRKGGVKRAGVIAASLVLAALFVLGALLSMMGARGRLADTREIAQRVHLVDWQNRSAATDNVVLLDSLRLHNAALDRTVWLGMGLNRNQTALRHANPLYLHQVRNFVERYLYRALVARLEDGNAAPLLDENQRKTLTEDLKAYLLLSDHLPTEFPDRRFLDEVEHRGFLARYLTDRAMRQLAAGFDGVEQANFQGRVEPQMQAFAEALQRHDSLRFTADSRLIAVTRNSIRRPFDYDFLYETLLSEGSHIPPFRLADLKGDYVNLLASTAVVPGVFTEDGLERYVSKQIDSLSADPTSGSWVMGPESETTSEEFGDKDKVAAELTDRYLRGYANAWEDFLRSVRVQNFSGLNAAASALQNLGSTRRSHIAYLLARVAKETRFAPEDDGSAGGAAGSEAASALQNAFARTAKGKIQRYSGLRLGNITLGGSGGGSNEPHLTPVDIRFQELHNLKAGELVSGGAAPNLKDAFAQLQALGNTLDEKAGDDGATYEFAGEVLQRNGGEMKQTLDAVQRILSGFPQIRQQLFEDPIIEAWDAVLADTRPYLDRQWQDEVYEAYQSEFELDGRYPFDRSSQRDARIDDVERFFSASEGKMETFVRDYLEPFIDDPRRVDEVETWQGRGIRLSSAAVNAIERGRVISRGLFKEDALRFALLPIQPDNPDNADIDQVTITIHGRSDRWDLGGAFPEDFAWPGEAHDANVSITMESGATHTKAYDGPWALFRLLQGGGVQRQQTDVYALRWGFDEPNYNITVRYQMTLQDGTPSEAFDNSRTFFNFRLPRSLF